MERIAYGEFGIHAMTHRGGGGWTGRSPCPLSPNTPSNTSSCRPSSG
jgi:hypothetical protein